MIGLEATLDVGLLALKLLAVAGGVAVGGLGGGALIRLLVRWTVQRPTPRPVVRLVQVLGAVVVGLAVWIWAFGPGGSGFGWGGGLGWGGSGQGSDKTTESNTDKNAPKKPPTSDKEPRPAGADVLRVEVLGGERVREQRFYVLVDSDDPQPKTLEELRRTIKTRQDAPNRPKLQRLEILYNGESVALGTLAMKNLEKLAEQVGLEMTLHKIGSS
jgi:hypothetical protein